MFPGPHPAVRRQTCDHFNGYDNLPLFTTQYGLVELAEVVIIFNYVILSDIHHTRAWLHLKLGYVETVQPVTNCSKLSCISTCGYPKPSPPCVRVRGTPGHQGQKFWDLPGLGPSRAGTFHGWDFPWTSWDSPWQSWNRLTKVYMLRYQLVCVFVYLFVCVFCCLFVFLLFVCVFVCFSSFL